MTLVVAASIAGIVVVVSLFVTAIHAVVDFFLTLW